MLHKHFQLIQNIKSFVNLLSYYAVRMEYDLVILQNQQLSLYAPFDKYYYYKMVLLYKKKNY